MRYIPLLVLALLVATPVSSQTVEELKAELAAQKVIIEMQRQRIETLEYQLSSVSPKDVKGRTPPPYTAPPPDTELEDEDVQALGRAFERRGLTLMAPGTYEISTSASWSHSGSDATGDAVDAYALRLGARTGLPGGFMLGVSLPYSTQYEDGESEDEGFGNATLTLWKRLAAETDRFPGVVANLSYSAPIDGDDGVESLTTGLSLKKNFDPLAVFASLSYTHAFDRDVEVERARRLGGRFDLPFGRPDETVTEERPGSLGVGVGVGLAVTPDISLSASLDWSFTGDITVDGDEQEDTSRSYGLFSVGAGFLVTDDLFVSVDGAFGVTDDSPDATLGVSTRYRF